MALEHVEQRMAAVLRPGARWLARRDFTRIELGTVVVFHAAGALFCALAPDRNLINRGNAPVFYLAEQVSPLAPRASWFLVFAAAAVAAVLCLRRPTGPRQLATWLLVFPTGATWIGCLILGLANGGGLFLMVAWSMLLTVWAVTAARLVQR